MFAVNVKGNLLEAAPKTTFELGVASFFTSLISGMPFKPNSKQFSSITSNFAMFSGINFSKFLISVNALKIYSADFSTFVLVLSKFIMFCFFLFQVS